MNEKMPRTARVFLVFPKAYDSGDKFSNLFSLIRFAHKETKSSARYNHKNTKIQKPRIFRRKILGFAFNYQLLHPHTNLPKDYCYLPVFLPATQPNPEL